MNNADVLCVTESWLSSDIESPYVSIPGYNLLRRGRPNSNGGSVCLYLLRYKLLK